MNDGMSYAFKKPWLRRLGIQFNYQLGDPIKIKNKYYVFESLTEIFHASKGALKEYEIPEIRMKAVPPGQCNTNY